MSSSEYVNGIIQEDHPTVLPDQTSGRGVPESSESNGSLTSRLPSILELAYGGPGYRRCSLPHPTLEEYSSVEMPWSQYPRYYRLPPRAPPNSPQSPNNSPPAHFSPSSFRIEVDPHVPVTAWTPSQESYAGSSVRIHSGNGSQTSSSLSLDPIASALHLIHIAHREIANLQDQLTPVYDPGSGRPPVSSYRENREKEVILHRLVTKVIPYVSELLHRTTSMTQQVMYGTEGRICVWGGSE